MANYEVSFFFSYIDLTSYSNTTTSNINFINNDDLKVSLIS